jgi:proteasome lid subunit RPN8/RPN11
VIQIGSDSCQQIRTQAESLYPEECCGLLLGRTSHGNRILMTVWATENSWNNEMADFVYAIEQSGSKCTRFRIAPEVMLQAQKTARDRNLEILGIYHSHPDCPAIPSEFDQAIAWPQYSYLIVSVQQGKVVDMRSWKLDENHQFQAEEIEVEG